MSICRDRVLTALFGALILCHASSASKLRGGGLDFLDITSLFPGGEKGFKDVFQAGTRDAATTVSEVSNSAVSQGLFSGLGKAFKDLAPEAAAFTSRLVGNAGGQMPGGQDPKQLAAQVVQGGLAKSEEVQQHAAAAMQDSTAQALSQTFQEGATGLLGNATRSLTHDVKKVDLSEGSAFLEAVRAYRYKDKKDPTDESVLVSTEKYVKQLMDDKKVPEDLKRSDENIEKFAATYRTNPVASIETTMGSMEVEVLLEEMPLTASNFLDLCGSGFYNGIHFHRVIPNFMIQTGDPISKDPTNPRAGTGNAKPGSIFKMLDGSGKKVRRGRRDGNIPDEFKMKIANKKYTLSMANVGTPNSGGSQFFVNVADNRHLDWFNKNTRASHPVFGSVITGMSVAEAISKVKTGRADAPKEPVMLIKCSVDPKALEA